METDRDIQDAIQIGQKNQDTKLLIHNWCRHARVQKMGGIGLIEAQTGLPIGHHSMACDYAPNGGMATWDLEEAAISFHDTNCITCNKRELVRIPNISKLVERRNTEKALRKAQQDEAKQQAQAKFNIRQTVRLELKNGSPERSTMVDDLESLDKDASIEASKKLIETARLAPEIFTEEVVNQFFDWIDQGENWFVQTGLQILSAIKVDPRRLTKSAMLSLSRHTAVSLSVGIVIGNLEFVDKSLLHKALFQIMQMACPMPFPHVEKRPHAGPLISIYSKYPDEVSSSIQKYLDDRDVYVVEIAVRSIVLLAKKSPSFPTQYLPSLLAKLARPHLSFDEARRDEERNVIGSITDAAVLALKASPDKADDVIQKYYESATASGEKRLITIYCDLISDARRSEHQEEDVAPYRVAIKRLLSVLTTTKNEDALRKIQYALKSGGKEADTAVLDEFDAVIGTAILLDDRIERARQEKTEPKSLLEVMEQENRMSLLYDLRSGLISWGANAAAEHQEMSKRFIELLEKVPAENDGIRAALVEHLHLLATTSAGLNAILPTLYSALLGVSTLQRAAALKALKGLGKRQGDLPDLVMEAFVALLYDPYMIVHQSGVSALESFDIPDKYSSDIKSAIENLIYAYRSDEKREHFLMDCIVLYAGRYLKESANRQREANVLLALMSKLKPINVVRDIRWVSKILCDAKDYVDFIVGLLSNDEIMSYQEEQIIDLLRRATPLQILEKRESIKNVAIKLVDSSEMISAYVEILTFGLSWTEAHLVAECAWSRIPMSTRTRSIKERANLLRIASAYEAALSIGELDKLELLSAQWDESNRLLEQYRLEHERRHPFTGILGAD